MKCFHFFPFYSALYLKCFFSGFFFSLSLQLEVGTPSKVCFLGLSVSSYDWFLSFCVALKEAERKATRKKYSVNIASLPEISSYLADCSLVLLVPPPRNILLPSFEYRFYRPTVPQLPLDFVFVNFDVGLTLSNAIILFQPELRVKRKTRWWKQNFLIECWSGW